MGGRRWRGTPGTAAGAGAVAGSAGSGSRTGRGPRLRRSPAEDNKFVLARIFSSSKQFKKNHTAFAQFWNESGR